MNWFANLIGVSDAINRRAAEIAEDSLTARYIDTETRSISSVTTIEPKRNTEGHIEAAIVGGSMSNSGIKITADSALRVSAALACSRLLAQGLAQPSCKILKENAEGSREDASGHPLDTLLSFSPNPEQTAYEFREQIGLHLALTQNAYVRKIYSGSRVVALWPIDPKDVTIIQHGDRSVTYDVVGDQKGLTSREIWHIKGLSWKGYIAEETIALAREALGLSLATEAYGSSLFLNGARPAGIVGLKGKPTADQINQAAAKWNGQYGGVANANKTAFIAADEVSYTTIGSTANDAQWTEARRYQIEEICRAFGVRPSMVYTTGATSYASVEQEFLAHVKFTLAPLHTNFEQSAAKALFTPADYKAGYRIKLNTNALLRGSIAERMNVIKTMVPLGLMTPNEARRLEDLAAFDFPEADQPTPAANLFGDTNTPTPSEDENNNEVTKE